MDVSLLLIEFCVLRITRIRPGKVLRNQSLSNSGLFAVVEQYFCVASFRRDSCRKRSFGSISFAPASLFKSFSAFADTAFSVKLHSSAAFRILEPQGLQTHFDKFWFCDKGSPIDPQHSAKISSALSCLPEGHSCSL